MKIDPYLDSEPADTAAIVSPEGGSIIYKT